MHKDLSPKLVPTIQSDKLEDYIKFSTEYNFPNQPLTHLDIMDGIYVETKSPSLASIIEILENNHEKIHKNFSIHLMVKDVLHHIDLIAEANERDLIFINLVYVHVDTITEEEFNFIKDEANIALTFSPNLNVEKYIKWIKQCESVMVMTVVPGKQGNPFLPEALEKIKDLRDLGYKGEIHLDGGINENTIPEILKFKPDLLNVGSAIQKAEYPLTIYKKIYEQIYSLSQ